MTLWACITGHLTCKLNSTNRVQDIIMNITAYVAETLKHKINGHFYPIYQTY